MVGSLAVVSVAEVASLAVVCAAEKREVALVVTEAMEEEEGLEVAVAVHSLEEMVADLVVGVETAD